jgi:hypothetical protein
MSGITPNLRLTTYNTITDASSVLVYTYVNQVSGSAATANLGIIDNFAGQVSGSIVNMSGSFTTINACLVLISGSLTAMSGSPATVPFVDFAPDTAIPPLSGLAVAPFEITEFSGSSTNKIVSPQLKFASSVNQGRQWKFKAPPELSGSNCTLKIDGRMASANTSKTIALVVQLACVNTGSTSGSAKQFAASQSATVTVPDAIGTQFQTSIPIVNTDGMVSDADMYAVLWRDTAVGNASGSFIYTGGRLHFP